MNMSESFAQPKKQEMSPASEVLDTQQTIEYLQSHNCRPLESFTPGKPLLYVFPEELRSDTGPLGSFYGTKRPTFVRMHAPTSLGAISELTTEKGEYGLANEDGATIEYYAINNSSNTFERIRTEHTVRTKEDPYVVRKEQLFTDNPSLFSE
jgi:hypothetical protein